MNGSLGIQAHLGDFAREGLKILVLGVRILTEDVCLKWLKRFETESISIKNRDDYVWSKIVIFVDVNQTNFCFWIVIINTKKM